MEHTAGTTLLDRLLELPLPLFLVAYALLEVLSMVAVLTMIAVALVVCAIAIVVYMGWVAAAFVFRAPTTNSN